MRAPSRLLPCATLALLATVAVAVTHLPARAGGHEAVGSGPRSAGGGGPLGERSLPKREAAAREAPPQVEPTQAGPTQAEPTRLNAERSVRKAAPPRRSPPGAEVITELSLRAHLGFIASDALEGRKTPSRGLDAAAAYLVSHLTRFGLRPAGDGGSFLQAITLTRRTVDFDEATLVAGSRTLAHGEDFLPGDTPGTVEGGLVYVGNGTVIRSRGVDPYKRLDVTGKIVVTHMGLPAGFTQADLKGPPGRDWEMPEPAARARGAVGVLYLPDYPTLVRWASTRDTRRTRATLTVDAFTDGDGPLPSATLSAGGIGALFSGQALGPHEAFQRAIRREPAEPFALTGVTARLRIPTSDESFVTHNVVAVLEGSDPALAREYVALGAHYDHLGAAPAPDAAGDAIYNGADDNGSGTVGLLAIAEAFATTRPRPKRSLLFVWHTGEEAGLWGSRYFTARPTVPLERIVAQLNVDMIGRGRPIGSPRASNPLALTELDSVYVVGSRRLSADLGRLVERVNASYHDLRLDYTLDTPGDSQDIYERSDHYPYANRGIPVAFFFTGVHEDYHGLDDEIEDIDFPKLRRVTQTVYGIARELATRRERPKVDAR